MAKDRGMDVFYRRVDDRMMYNDLSTGQTLCCLE